MIGALLFSALHPAFAAGLAMTRGIGDMVQICTGAGMAWVRVGDRAIVVGDAAGAMGDRADGAPARSDGAPDSPCPFCLGGVLAPPSSDAGGRPMRWPQSATFVPASAPERTPASERVVLDAPTRGPPGAA